MEWLKLYHDLRTDRKVETLADDEYRTFINLLVFASEQEAHRGDIAGLDDDLIALEVCRGDVVLLARTLDRLQRLRIVSVGTGPAADGVGVTRYIAFLNFAKRQARKPSDEPGRILERVRKHREGKRNAPDQERNATVTRYVTPPVTPVTPRNAYREEGEGEEDSSPTEKRGRVSGAVAPAPHQAVVNAWMAAVGRDPERAKDYSRYVAVGAEMAGRGDTPQDVGNCTRYLATDPWRQEKSKAPALTDVRDALPMWRDSGRPARVAAGPKPNGKPPGGQEYLMHQLALVRQQSEQREEQQRGPDGPRRLPGGPVQAGRHAE